MMSPSATEAEKASGAESRVICAPAPLIKPSSETRPALPVDGSGHGRVSECSTSPVPVLPFDAGRGWASATAEPYRRSAGLDDEGFIHLSFAHQVKGVADAFYRGMTDLVLLELDPERLGSSVVMESRFPHLYGEMDVEAVKLASPYRPRPDGTFDPLA